MDSPLTFQQLHQKGLLEELARVFSDSALAKGVLLRINYPETFLPAYINSMSFWQETCYRIANGLTPGGLEGLLRAAAAEFPYNQRFEPWRESVPRSPERSDTPDPDQPADSPGHRHSAQESAGSSPLTRLVVEVRNQRFKVDEPPSQHIGEFRTKYLDLTDVIPAGSPRRARILHVRQADDLVPLRLEKSLAEAGLRDGAVLRLSLMIDEEGQPEDLCPFLERTLAHFYSGRIRQLDEDAWRVLSNWSPGSHGSEATLVQAGLQEASQQWRLPDLTVLAAMTDPADRGIKSAVGRLAWYGPPEEVGPAAWVYIRPEKQRALERLWLSGGHRNTRSQRGTSTTRKPVSGS